MPIPFANILPMFNLNKIIISGIHFNVSENLKSFVLTKCEKLVKHQKFISSLRFELEKDSHSSTHSNEYVAKGHMEIKGSPCSFSSSSDSMYKSIDELVDKLERSIRRDRRILKKQRKFKKDSFQQKINQERKGRFI